MTAALPLSPRLLALLGAGLAVVLALLVARPLLLSDGSSADSASLAGVTPKPAATSPTSTSGPATPIAPVVPTVPKIVLLDGLPKVVATQLRASRVAVIALYTRTGPTDRAAVKDARQGARAAGASFVAIDLLGERAARDLQRFVGTVGTPTVLVVRRPGRIVTQLEGRVDSAVVEQAAHNAGARR